MGEGSRAVVAIERVFAQGGVRAGASAAGGGGVGVRAGARAGLRCV